jgi:cell division protein FtsN
MAVWKYVAAAVIIPIGFYSFWIPMKTNVLESGILSIKDFNPLYRTSEGLYKSESLSKLSTAIQSEESLEKAVQSIPSDVSNYAFKFNEDIYINVRLKSTSVTIEKPVDEIQEVSSIEVVKPIVRATKKSFDLVVGVFSAEANATNLINSLKTKGFNAKIVDKNGELFRVSAGTTSTNEEILKIKEKALTAGIDGWILKK